MKRERLSCISWKCIMLASKSAIASDSSAKAGSKALRGKDASVPPAPRAESRNEDREEGRRGVVGREVRDLEFERLSPDRGVWLDMLSFKINGSHGRSCFGMQSNFFPTPKKKSTTAVPSVSRDAMQSYVLVFLISTVLSAPRSPPTGAFT